MRPRTAAVCQKNGREGLKAPCPVVYTAGRLRTLGWGHKANV